MGAREDAQTAIYKAAEAAAARSQTTNSGSAAQLLTAAAIAFRAVEGGQQIGGVHLDS